MALLDDARAAVAETITHVKKEIGGLRTGRANPMLVEDIAVEAYSAKQPIKSLATITVPEPRLIQIAPWDKSLLTAMEKAITLANIGLNPSNDGAVIRVPIPALTEETRRELVKNLKQRVEAGRIRLRQHREEIKKAIEQLHKSGELSEDQKFHDVEQLDALVKACNESMEKLGSEKEAEIMKI